MYILIKKATELVPNILFFFFNWCRSYFLELVNDFERRMNEYRQSIEVCVISLFFIWHVRPC